MIGIAKICLVCGMESGKCDTDFGIVQCLQCPGASTRPTLRGIDEQVAKAQRAVDGHAPVKRNRYIQLAGATKSVNRTLEAKTRALAHLYPGDAFVAEGIKETLRRLGHEVTLESDKEAFNFGGAQIVLKTDAGYVAGSDPRKDGLAVGL